ncbi:hypothetical protein [Candidatus Poriferisodalis sp.]|uniref:hypothetical protein n=1 Tax=Candidatus Poriferisodalis sp. TaxID=3101277 RepID=UPI003AF72EBB
MSGSARQAVGRRVLLCFAASAVLTAATAGCTNAPPPSDGRVTPAGIEPAAPSFVTTTAIGAVPASTAPRREPEDTVSEASEMFETREIAFEEIVVHERLRVPQTDQDTKGALFRSYRESQHKFAGVIFDACQFEDAFVGLHRRHPDSRDGEPTRSQRDEVDFYRYRLGCPGWTAYNQPLWGQVVHRWFTFDTFGSESPSFASHDEAVEWYEQGSAVRHKLHADTLPPFSGPLGFRSTQFSSFASTDEYVIRYAPVDAPVDEVGVVPGSVSVVDGVLRGLVRNWSRTLWAYGVNVRADGRSWLWPLSVQPGEVAPFEFEDWDGPGDPAGIGFEVAAEFSNDADLSRSFEFLQQFESTYGPREEFSGWLPAEIEGELALDAATALTVALDPMSREFEVSHPSLGGRWAPGVVESLRGFVAHVDPDGRLVELSALTPFHSPGHSYRGRTDNGPLVVMRSYPPLEAKLGDPPPYVNFAFALWPDTDWMFWIGGVHPPPG